MDTNTNTDCRKCKAAMPPVSVSQIRTGISIIKMTVTGYRCPHCEHWNNLKACKPRKSSVG